MIKLMARMIRVKKFIKGVTNMIMHDVSCDFSTHFAGQHKVRNISQHTHIR